MKQCWPITERTKFESGLGLDKNPNGTASRSSCPKVFCKEDVLKKVTKFTGMHLCWSPFLIKLQDLRPVTLLKRDSSEVYFFRQFCIFSRINFFTKQLLLISLDYNFVSNSNSTFLPRKISSTLYKFSKSGFSHDFN